MPQTYSLIIESFLEQVKGRSQNLPRLYQIFENCYKDTLDAAATALEDGSVYLVTGDIPAMWLRDSAAQMRPYLYCAEEYPEIRQLICGVIKRQFFYIGIDPYANAFNLTPSGACYEKEDLNPDPWLWERKFELDSLCYPIQLSYLLWKNTGCTAQFDSQFQKGAEIILDLFQREQTHEENSAYRFIRKNTYPTETLSREGKGSLCRSGTGLIWSGFRPSDDACTYGYLIPANMFAAVALGYLAQIEKEIFHNPALSQRALELKESIENGIETYGKALTKEFGLIYAYETDGWGMYNLMDDAGIPGLLSMEYFGYCKDPETAENTKRFVLSEGNPYYYKGKKADGIGSPHTRFGYVWPLSMAVRGLIASAKEEKLEALEQIAATTGGKNMIHESFFCDDDSLYTREWFSWANAMYAELFLDYLGYKLIK